MSVSAGAESLSDALAAASGLARLFGEAGRRLYLVGGVVREAVAGRTLQGADLDCTTDALPAEVRVIVAAAATSLWTQGERFGTIGCVVTAPRRSRSPPTVRRATTAARANRPSPSAAM